MRVLIACEFSGVVREAFRGRGHDAWSCDLLPCSDGSPYHIQGDAEVAAYAPCPTGGEPWDLMIAHPPCTYLCSSGLHWNRKVPGREALTQDALRFVRALLNAPIERIALENPVGKIGTAIRPADQFIQPFDFGEDASKRTGLWLKNLPKLQPTERVPGRTVQRPDGRMVERWGNQTDSGQNRLGPSEDRWKDRSVTYAGIARAMAEQWG